MNIADADLLALITTLKLATVTTVILLCIGTPLAWYLAKMQSRFKVFFEAIIALPLVLPATVLGFYLLLALSPTSLPGQIWQTVTGSQLAFSFSALVIGSVIYSLPFVVQPLQKAFEQLGEHYLEAAASLGANARQRFFHIVLPLTKASFVTATALGFAHTVGEFGIVLMIGGNIPGETRVLSIALFDHVEAFNYDNAHILSVGLLIGSLLLLSWVYYFARKRRANKIVKSKFVNLSSSKDKQ